MRLALLRQYLLLRRGYLSGPERGKLAGQLCPPVYLGRIEVDPDTLLAAEGRGGQEATRPTDNPSLRSDTRTRDGP